MKPLNKLKGKIIENGYGIESFAKIIGLSRQSLGAKLNGKRCFTVIEIQKICKALSIYKYEVGDYFF